jgi:tetratricopeptide (TPR) repeat protein
MSTLLKKYDIPVEFLDFEYIKSCTDARMIEKIVKILRSGEEGYFPDLTKCAEDKLKELKPCSKMFRTEEPIKSKDQLDDEARSKIEDEIKSFVDEMKKQDEILKDIKPKEKKNEPPIRKAKKPIATENSHTKKPEERINSFDYAKWDKYDADAVTLKMDLDEERQREIVDVKNKKNLEKSKLIEVIEDDDMSDFEKNRLSLMFKERGNEAYKAKDYEEAIKEYTQSIEIKKNAAAYNNRALVCKFID